MDAAIVMKAHLAVEQAPWYIIRPASYFMGVWDLTTSAALILTALVTPYEVSFLEPNGTDGLFIMNRCIDTIFILDMCIQFFLMYQIADDSAGGTGKARMEIDLKKIARHYLRTWFTIDVLSIIPSIFDILPLIEGTGFDEGDTDGLKVMRIVRTARLVKLVRLVRGSRLLLRWRTRINVSFNRLAIYSLCVELILGSHWLACLLSLLTGFGRRVDSWMGAFGWCTDDPAFFDNTVDVEVCVPTSVQWLVCAEWAFGIISGFGSSPAPGPYPPVVREVTDEGSGGNRKFTDGEMFMDVLWIFVSAIGRAYVTARVVAIVVQRNPDWTAFKQRMDKLNMYINYYNLPSDMSQKLRECASRIKQVAKPVLYPPCQSGPSATYSASPRYFYETRAQMAANSRQQIVEQMTVSLQEAVSARVQSKWLNGVPFFRGMKSLDGRHVCDAVEPGFLAKVAVALKSSVFAPLEKPPTCKLYIIMKGCARYRGSVRGLGYCWGALDVMLTNVGDVMPIPRATSIDYLHVAWVDGQTLRRIANEFPLSRHSLRVWTMINGIKEFMLHTLRTAPAEEREKARRWVQDQAAARKNGTHVSAKRKSPVQEPSPSGRPSSEKFQLAHATSFFELQQIMEKRLENVDAATEALDSRFDLMDAAMRSLEQRMEVAAEETAAAAERQEAANTSMIEALDRQEAATAATMAALVRLLERSGEGGSEVAMPIKQTPSL